MPFALKAKVIAGAAGGATILTLTGLTMFMGAGDDQASGECGTSSSAPAGGEGDGGGNGNAVEMSEFKGKTIHGPQGNFSGQQITIGAHVVKAVQDLHGDSKTQALAVMVGMGESQLTNVQHGDAAGPDSIGVFQQRANGAWGSLSDRTNPDIAAKNFTKALMKVPNYKSLSPTEAGHRTQGNADPNYYSPYWKPAVELVSLVTKDPDLLKKLPSVGGGAGSDSCGGGYLPPNGIGNKVFNEAKKKVDAGQKYVLGGGLVGRPWSDSGPMGQPRPGGLEGTDCSGLARYAYATATDGKFVMTHLAAGQWDWVKQHHAQVNVKDIQPGDLLFFHGSQPGHVAIAGPNGDLVEQAGPDGAPGKYIKDWQHHSPWHQQTFIGAGRPSKANVGGSDSSASSSPSN